MENSSSAGTPIFFDPSGFEVQTSGDIEIQKATAAAFIEHTPGMLADIREAKDANDEGKVRYLIHKMKATVSLLCHDILKEEIAILEKESHRVGQNEYNMRVEILLKNVNILIQEVKAHLKTLMTGEDNSYTKR